MEEIACPICNADLLLTGDEKEGETVYCSFCSSPLRVHKSPSKKSLSIIDDT